MAKPYINAIKTKDNGDCLIVEGKYSPAFEIGDDKKGAFCRTIKPAYDAAILVKGAEKKYVTLSIDYGDEGRKNYFVNLGKSKEGKSLVVLKDKDKEDAEPIFININEIKKAVGDKTYPKVMLSLSEKEATKLNLDKIEVSAFKNKEGVDLQEFKTLAFYNVSDGLKTEMIRDIKEAGEGGRLELQDQGSYSITTLKEMWASNKTQEIKTPEAPKVKEQEAGIDM